MKKFIFFLKNIFASSTREEGDNYLTFTQTWTKILNEEKPKTLTKVNLELENKNIDKAIKILEGFLVRHPYAQDIHNLLGDLYKENNEFAKAGRHYYLKGNKSESDIEAVNAFRKKFGNDPLYILKELLSKLKSEPIAFADIYERNYKLEILDEYSILMLEKLLKETIEKHKTIPGFAKDLHDVLPEFIKRKNKFSNTSIF